MCHWHVVGCLVVIEGGDAGGKMVVVMCDGVMGCDR